MGLIDNNEIIYKSSKSFFWASKFLSEEILQKVINIYSFCRIHDDLVDENIEATDKKEIEQLEQKIKSYGISGDVISELIKGINSDINFQRYKNNAALIKYCYRVAGIVGLMMIKALKIKDIEASYYAIDLGIAMQLTNISRDVLEDSKNNRFYIEGNFEKISSTINLANRYYQDSFYAIKSIPISFRFSILVARRVYRKIGFKILKKKTLENYQRSGKIYVSNIEKVLETFLSIFDLISLFLINKNEDQIQHDHILINEEINLNERI